MRNQSIVILSSDDWGWKTSKYQLSIRFARDNRVLFVSSIGFRAPTVSRADFSRIWFKLNRFLEGPREVERNIWVLTPIVIPFGRNRLVAALNRRILAWQIDAASRRLRIERPHLFVFSPNWYPFVANLDRTALVYYCVDEHSGFSGVDAQKFLLWDEALTVNSDHVICSAKSLFNKKKLLNERTHYLPHGVNWAHFAEYAGGGQGEAVLDKLTGPRLLFFGHLSYDWVDTSLLHYLAEKEPEWNIILVGRNSLNADEFSKRANVILIGEREYDDLPAICRYADIGIIPFVDSTLTRPAIR